MKSWASRHFAMPQPSLQVLLEPERYLEDSHKEPLEDREEIASRDSDRSCKQSRRVSDVEDQKCRHNRPDRGDGSGIPRWQKKVNDPEAGGNVKRLDTRSHHLVFAHAVLGCLQHVVQVGGQAPVLAHRVRDLVRLPRLEQDHRVGEVLEDNRSVAADMHRGLGGRIRDGPVEDDRKDHAGVEVGCHMVHIAAVVHLGEVRLCLVRRELKPVQTPGFAPRRV